ncbi:MAG: lipopolysaccharide kinase InaA family protein [Kiritimatiellae bacterium]|nr:lipopolysaccharide kinase InaA family protein [Kiritimatiellia bacterium]
MGLWWCRFLSCNLRFMLAGGYLLPGRHRLAGAHAVGADFFGLCVASAEDPACDDYAVAQLRELGIRHVRFDYTYASAGSFAERFLNRLLDEGFAVCLHLVQPLSEARLMPAEPARSAWGDFVAATLDRYGARLECVEIGVTCNRRKWSGYTLAALLAAWRSAHAAARARGVTVAAPNVTDFEPVFNVGLLGLARVAGMLPDIHTDNLFAERATEPENYDHKVAGRLLAGLAKYNLVKKAALLRRIATRAGVSRLMCTHVAWSERRIRRMLADPEGKQADYLQRYLCLLAAAGTFDRVYWGPMIGQREGIIDDGTREYPDLPHVALYAKANGAVSGYRRRPAFDALRTVVRLLSNANFVCDHARSRDLRILEFATAEGSLHIVWTTNGHGFDPATWYDQETLARATVTARDGTTAPVFPCIIGESPMFLAWRGARPVFRGLPPTILPHCRLHSDQGVIYRSVTDGRWRGVVALRPEQNQQAAMAAVMPAQLEGNVQREVLRAQRNVVWKSWLTAEGRDCQAIVKRSPTPPWHRRLLDAGKPSRARRGWNGACELLRRGISTARPIAFFEDATHPRGAAGYFITEAVETSGAVRDAFNTFARGEDRYAGIAKTVFYEELAVFLRHMHAKGCYFGDLSSGNILVRLTETARPAFTLIDTTRAVFYQRHVSSGRVLADLKRVCHRLTWPERRAFLDCYYAGRTPPCPSRVALVFGLYDAKHWLKRLSLRKRPRAVL